MTGSGKTGLCLALLEEAAIDGIPVHRHRPQGRPGNLLLTFPELRPEDFRPWVNEEDARPRRARRPTSSPRSRPSSGSKGLAEWGQDGARIAGSRDAADFAIYTPGQQRRAAGLASCKSFAAPRAGDRCDDAELARASASARR